MEVTGVKLDPQSRTGIWMSEDLGKVFSHSILDKNLLSNRKNYESFFNMGGDTLVKFITYSTNSTYIFAVGRKQFGLFNIERAVSSVLCSSSESSFD